MHSAFCPDASWRFFHDGAGTEGGHSCIKFFPGPSTWVDAKGACEAVASGAHLLSVSEGGASGVEAAGLVSTAHQLLLQKAGVAGKAWVGASKSWSWVDASPSNNLASLDSESEGSAYAALSTKLGAPEVSYQAASWNSAIGFICELGVASQASSDSLVLVGADGETGSGDAILAGCKSIIPSCPGGLFPNSPSCTTPCNGALGGSPCPNSTYICKFRCNANPCTCACAP